MGVSFDSPLLPCRAEERCRDDAIHSFARQV
jgi:hypothetical protein